MPRPPPRKPRPADLAIVGNRMIVQLIRAIWNMAYKPGLAELNHAHNENFSSGAGVMWLHFLISIATAEGRLLTEAQIVRQSITPRSNVRRNLAVLEKLGKIRRLKQGRHVCFEANLAALDDAMTLEHVDKWIVFVRQTVDEWQRLRDLLLPELRANSAAAAARKREK